MLKWKQKTVEKKANGARTIIYTAESFQIVRRTEALPHSNHGGCWLYTSFVLFRAGKIVGQFNTMAACKAVAERMCENETSV